MMQVNLKAENCSSTESDIFRTEFKIYKYKFYVYKYKRYPSFYIQLMSVTKKLECKYNQIK